MESTAMTHSGPLSVGMLTKEWPPHIYGGAGVHVTNLVESLAINPELSITTHCFGSARNDAKAYELSESLAKVNPALQTLLINLDMSRNLSQSSLVHSHTWYANFAGFLAHRMYEIPHVITAHSLEPLRPWKAEQLGSGYEISSWIEKKAYESASAIIAVSDGMAADVKSAYPLVDPRKIHTIRNGINVDRFKPHHDPSILARYSIDFPYALFVGRITRQKGLAHLLRAWREVPSHFGLVVAASNPDEPAIGAEVEELITELQKSRSNVIWIKEKLPHEELITFLTSALVFACPSIYEPLGIVNLEAMACETAVVASRVGGIPEVVDDGVTGILVDYSSDTHSFEEKLTAALMEVMENESRAKEFGLNGRARAINEFGWDKVASQTIALYRSLL